MSKQYVIWTSDPCPRCMGTGKQYSHRELDHFLAEVIEHLTLEQMEALAYEIRRSSKVNQDDPSPELLLLGELLEEHTGPGGGT